MGVRIKIAATADELDELFQVRHRVFVREKRYFPPVDDGRLLDRFDAFPTTANIVAMSADHVVGGVRIVEPSGSGAPADEFFDFRPYLPEGAIVGSGSMLVMDEEFRRVPRVTFAMLGMMYYWALCKGLTHITGVAAPEAVKLFLGSGYKPVAKAVLHGPSQLPALPVMLDIVELNDRFSAFVDKHQFRHFLQSFERQFHQKGEYIIRRGDAGTSAYVIIEGRVGVSVGGPSRAAGSVPSPARRPRRARAIPPPPHRPSTLPRPHAADRRPRRGAQPRSDERSRGERRRPRLRARGPEQRRAHAGSRHGSQQRRADLAPRPGPGRRAHLHPRGSLPGAPVDPGRCSGIDSGRVLRPRRGRVLRPRRGRRDRPRRGRASPPSRSARWAPGRSSASLAPDHVPPALRGRGLALTDVDLMVLEREAFYRQVSQNPDVALNLLSVIGNRLMSMTERLSEVTDSRPRREETRAPRRDGLRSRLVHERFGPNLPYTFRLAAAGTGTAGIDAMGAGAGRRRCGARREGRARRRAEGRRAGLRRRAGEAAQEARRRGDEAARVPAPEAPRWGPARPSGAARPSGVARPSDGRGRGLGGLPIAKPGGERGAASSPRRLPRRDRGASRGHRSMEPRRSPARGPGVDGAPPSSRQRWKGRLERARGDGAASTVSSPGSLATVPCWKGSAGSERSHVEVHRRHEAVGCRRGRRSLRHRRGGHDRPGERLPRRVDAGRRHHEILERARRSGARRCLAT